jgi:CRISPR-associated Csx10 family RAMP protein
MSTIEITFTLETPACLSSAPAQGNEVQTLRYIPGGVLRGMLAEAYLRKNGKKADARFTNLFSETGLRFGNLMPLEGGSWVTPLSAYACKRFSGFEADPLLPDGERPHGIFNLLFEDMPDAVSAPKRRCSTCGQSLSVYTKPFCYEEAGTLQSVTQKITTHMRTSVGSGGSARGGYLFSQEELAAGSQFRGYVSGLPAELNALLKALSVKPTQFVSGFVGRRRSGRGTIKFGVPAPTEVKPVTINKSGSSEDWPVLGSLADPVPFFKWPGSNGKWLTLTLASDAILVDRLLRPVTHLKTKADLVIHLGFPSEVEIEIKKAFTARRMVAGWSGIGEMFRPDDLALAAGSTFILYFPNDAPDAVQKWAVRLLDRGIGLRRAEGFGQVTFAHPLHLRSIQGHYGSKPQ